MTKGIHVVRRLGHPQKGVVSWEMSPSDARELADFLELEDGRSKATAEDVRLLRAAADILDPSGENLDA
jgi:hypothetical protein